MWKANRLINRYSRYVGMFEELSSKAVVLADTNYWALIQVYQLITADHINHLK